MWRSIRVGRTTPTCSRVGGRTVTNETQPPQLQRCLLHPPTTINHIPRIHFSTLWLPLHSLSLHRLCSVTAAFLPSRSFHSTCFIQARAANKSDWPFEALFDVDRETDIPRPDKMSSSVMDFIGGAPFVAPRFVIERGLQAEKLRPIIREIRDFNSLIESLKEKMLRTKMTPKEMQELTTTKRKLPQRLEELLAVVQTNPTAVKYRLTLEDYSIIFYQCSVDPILHRLTRPFFELLRQQQLSALQDWNNRNSVPSVKPPSKTKSKRSKTATSTSSSTPSDSPPQPPSILHIPSKVLNHVVTGLSKTGSNKTHGDDVSGPLMATKVLTEQIIPWLVDKDQKLSKTDFDTPRYDHHASLYIPILRELCAQFNKYSLDQVLDLFEIIPARFRTLTAFALLINGCLERRESHRAAEVFDVLREHLVYYKKSHTLDSASLFLLVQHLVKIMDARVVEDTAFFASLSQRGSGLPAHEEEKVCAERLARSNDERAGHLQCLDLYWHASVTLKVLTPAIAKRLLDGFGTGRERRKMLEIASEMLKLEKLENRGEYDLYVFDGIEPPPEPTSVTAELEPINLALTASATMTSTQTTPPSSSSSASSSASAATSSSSSTSHPALPVPPCVYLDNGGLDSILAALEVEPDLTLHITSFENIFAAFKERHDQALKLLNQIKRTYQSKSNKNDVRTMLRDFEYYEHRVRIDEPLFERIRKLLSRMRQDIRYVNTREAAHLQRLVQRLPYHLQMEAVRRAANELDPDVEKRFLDKYTPLIISTSHKLKRLARLTPSTAIDSSPATTTNTITITPVSPPELTNPVLEEMLRWPAVTPPKPPQPLQLNSNHQSIASKDIHSFLDRLSPTDLNVLKQLIQEREGNTISTDDAPAATAATAEPIPTPPTLTTPIPADVARLSKSQRHQFVRTRFIELSQRDDIKSAHELAEQISALDMWWNGSLLTLYLACFVRGAHAHEANQAFETIKPKLSHPPEPATYRHLIQCLYESPDRPFFLPRIQVLVDEMAATSPRPVLFTMRDYPFLIRSAHKYGFTAEVERWVNQVKQRDMYQFLDPKLRIALENGEPLPIELLEEEEEPIPIQSQPSTPDSIAANEGEEDSPPTPTPPTTTTNSPTSIPGLTHSQLTQYFSTRLTELMKKDDLKATLEVGQQITASTDVQWTKHWLTLYVGCFVRGVHTSEADEAFETIKLKLKARKEQPEPAAYRNLIQCFYASSDRLSFIPRIEALVAEMNVYPRILFSIVDYHFLIRRARQYRLKSEEKRWVGQARRRKLYNRLDEFLRSVVEKEEKEEEEREQLAAASTNQSQQPPTTPATLPPDATIHQQAESPLDQTNVTQTVTTDQEVLKAAEEEVRAQDQTVTPSSPTTSSTDAAIHKQDESNHDQTNVAAHAAAATVQEVGTKTEEEGQTQDQTQPQPTNSDTTNHEAKDATS